MEKNNDELKPLNPQKHAARRFIKKYEEKEVVKPAKQPIYLGFPQQIKNFIITNKMIIIAVLAVLIILFFVLLFIKPTPQLYFIDATTGEYIQGYVYLDGVEIGSTTGNRFKDVPKIYCNGTHNLKLVSGEKSFEWQTYPIDCRSKKVNFYVNHEKEPLPKYITFRIIDKANKSVSGNIYFDGVFIQKISEDISLNREKCFNISEIRFDYGINLTVKKEFNKAFCNSTDLVEFRVS